MPLRTDFTDSSEMTTDHAAHHNALATQVNAASVPPGGIAGQLLAKTSGTDYAASWSTPPASRNAAGRVSARALFR